MKKVYAADFETTTLTKKDVRAMSHTSEGYIPKTSVWSFCMMRVGEEESPRFSWNIEDAVDQMQATAIFNDSVIWFHNEKFDGSFILDYLEKSDRFEEFSDKDGNLIDHLPNPKTGKRKKAQTVKHEMKSGQFTYFVDDTGTIYYIKLKVGKNMLEIRDSYKLLPFSLKEIGEGFETKHKKLDMDYGNKYPGYVPTKEELEYIKNDVYVLKEGLEKVSELSGYEVDKLPLTIGTMCMKDFREITDPGYCYNGRNYNSLFPSQTSMIDQIGITFDEYVRKSYHGGWCYVKDEYRFHEINRKNISYNLTMREIEQISKQKDYIGYTYDVNSLYPSVMHSSSKCFYPVGVGHYVQGNIDPRIENGYKYGMFYYFIRVQCEFILKDNHLPTIQIKDGWIYPHTQWLTSSNVLDRKTGEIMRHRVTLVLTCTDWELMKEQYNVIDPVILDYVWYRGKTGIFDRYIDKWYKIKMKSKGAKRKFSKLMLNNLYGKFSTRPSGNYTVFKLNPRSESLYMDVKFEDDPDRATYIPVGSAITSWARKFTIDRAQANFKRFVYSDTDSLHMIGPVESSKMIEEDPKKLGCWKLETKWDKAIFAGPKRYIEHIVEKDGERVEPFHKMTCCGMNEQAKFNYLDFLNMGKYGYETFNAGLIVGGNTKNKRISGGTVILEAPFKFHDSWYIK